MVVLSFLALVVVTRAMFVDLYRVDGVSMMPTLRPGQYVLADKTAFGNSLFASFLSRDATPARGDVVIFMLGGRGTEHAIKRVVALPGDTLSMRQGRLHLDRQPLVEPYLDSKRGAPDVSDRPESWHFSHLISGKEMHSYDPTGHNWGPIVVPDEAFFVLGDHRSASSDSRDYGFVLRNELVARSVAFLR